MIIIFIIIMTISATVLLSMLLLFHFLCVKVDINFHFIYPFSGGGHVLLGC